MDDNKPIYTQINYRVIGYNTILFIHKKCKTMNNQVKKQGVISTIHQIIIEAKDPISEEQILDKMEKLFPDRSREAMKRTVKVQISGKSRPTPLEIKHEFKMKITVEGGVKFYFNE